MDEIQLVDLFLGGIVIMLFPLVFHSVYMGCPYSDHMSMLVSVVLGGLFKSKCFIYNCSRYFGNICTWE